MEIDDGGGLYFKSVMDNDELNAAIAEALRRVQGLSDGTVAGGKRMDAAFDASSESIRAALEKIGAACETQEAGLAKLEAEYQRLGKEASAAFSAGRDDEYNAIIKRQTAVEGEITVHERLLKELREQSDAFEEDSAKIEENRLKAESASAAHASFRTRLREVREALAEMEEAGQRGTAEYTRLQQEAGRLTNAMGDAQTQARILANDDLGLQGVISAVNGVSGAMAIGTGAMQLFGEGNEDLQKAMVKVQSVMAISMGLQQLMNTLNKDSAASLGLVGGLKRWWAGVVAKATVAETSETVATGANTIAQTANAAATGTATGAQAANMAATGGQATAATAGTVANIGLAGAFRMVGVAIKSIPVFGWIVAGISALIGLYAVFSSKAREAKKAQEEFSKALVEGCYKSIGTIQELSAKYSELGDDMEAKQKFIRQNKRAFDELGASVKTVADAENVLIKNRETFIDAQVAKAKAMVYTQQAMEEAKKVIEAQQTLDSTPKARVSKRGDYYDGYGVKRNGMTWVKSDAWQKAEDDLEEHTKKQEELLEKARQETEVEYDKLTQAGVKAVNEYEEGTVGAIEQAIQEKQDALKNLKPDSKAWKDAYDEIEKLQRQIENPTGGKKNGGSSNSASKDPFKEKLDSYKSEYERFRKWINSGDEIIAKAANTEFSGLLKEGATYIDYLKKQRDEILSVDVAKRTKEQNARFSTLNDSIAEETKKTVLETFNGELSEQLTNAKTAMEMLGIIKERRDALAEDLTEVGNEKRRALDDAEKAALARQEQETAALLENYSSYLDKKLQMEKQYANDIALLEKARDDATSDAERERAERSIDVRKTQFNKDNLQINFDRLKESPDYVRAFEDLKNTSTETLQYLLERFEEVKGVVANSLNPEDLREYTNTMMDIVNELNERDPFTAIKKGYQEIKAAGKELALAQQNLNAIRQSGGAGTDEETAAIARVNKAKDNYIKKNNQVKAAEKVVTDSVKDLCKELSNVGDAMGGAAGQIISLIGDVGSFTLGAIQAFDTAAKSSSAAIRTVERASIILAIISTALQVVTKIASLFAGDDGEAAYEKAENVYKAYIDILDDVIDKQKELMASMSNENAVKSHKYALALIKQESEAARELGQQYLNAGASKGFLGVGSKASHGVSQHDDISDAAWQQFNQVARNERFSTSVANGRMTGLFDLSAKQLQQLKENAPVFWAQLHEDTRKYLQQIIDCEDAVKQMKDALNESFTGISFDSMADDFLETLMDMDADAATFSKNFSDYMRKALIQNMFKAQYREQLNEWYKMWSDAMNPDGEGGAAITTNEQNALDTLKNSIVQGATAAADAINKQFDTAGGETDTSLKGAVKGVSEETASLVAGQMNAIRINQMESKEILINQLAYLSTIAANTSYNRHLADIRNDIRDMKNSQSNASLRSQGL